MCARYLHVLFIALALWILPTTASAWVETSIRSHTATVDLDRSGRATVSHALILKVRGGPLKSVRVDGVDEDAELNSDATVTRVRSGSKQQWPLLVHKSDEGSVTLEVDDLKGLGGGVYHFEFSYRSNFVKRDLLQQRGGSVQLSWVGPRLADGIDSAKAVFRVPKGDTAPRLPAATADDDSSGDLEGLLVSQLRRGPDKDELELVRAHVAEGEPAVWRLQASARSFDAFTPPEVQTAIENASDDGSLPPLRISWLAIALVVAFAYANLVGLKWAASNKASLAKRAQPRALIPLPSALRAALSGIALGAALVVGVAVVYPTLAGVLLVLSMLLASQLPPRIQVAMRGPGTWKRLTDDEAFRVRRAALPGRWLDSGTLPGFLAFGLGLSAFVAAAVVLFPKSPYQAVIALLGSACLLPLFCTGRATELPPDPVSRPRKLFATLARRLRENGWRVTALARVPDRHPEPDELRLLIEPPNMPRGLLAIEIGLEYQVGSGAVVDLPCLIVRARDDSPAYFALPRSVVWSRGRTSSERVALLRPKLPTRALCARLTEEVVNALAQAATRGHAQPAQSRSRSMSSGRRQLTAKAGSAVPA